MQLRNNITPQSSSVFEQKRKEDTFAVTTLKPVIVSHHSVRQITILLTNLEPNCQL